MADSTVLVVEDEEGLAELYTAWLAEEYSVRTAFTAKGAFEELDADVDVALLDRRLPDSSGDEVVTEIRNRGLDTRVAMVTAVDPDLDIIDLGFDSYVVKPVDREELLDVVEKLLRRSHYDADVREYFSLAATRTALEQELNPAELDGSDEFQELTSRLETLKDSLDSHIDDLETEDYRALFNEL